MGDASALMKSASVEQRLFAEALQCDSPPARASILDAGCGSDVAMRQRVEALLRAAESADDFLDKPPAALQATVDLALDLDTLSEKPGDRIGRYKLLEKIGEGGCGVVYMAEQEEPVRRRVALKVIKLGMDTRAVVARFEAERQALALMDHSNIAKVLDGGATHTGRPYFVMELVRGVRITEFCDEAQLPTRARLTLFVQVCHAIQHAHQKGIIHRDLKPSNILVTVNDGVPVPKVIDFGIAKATGQRLTDKTLFTQFHSFIGTPAYTSPEQAEMSSVDIDTRSDIYSLGVLLYELLTGRTPFDGEKLMSAGIDEMRRIIRHDEPPRPSNRLDTLGLADATALTGKRKASLPELAGDVRGDLDWIVMKCLEKDRARRYDTANGIAADIKRHLSDEPVAARPPSRIYLLQKLARRHRGLLSAVTIILATLLVAVLALASSNAQMRAEKKQKDLALKERSAALEAARFSEQGAREQLFVSLQSQAQARRYSRQIGQRLESLAALAEAARIRPAAELRDSAIAAMALPDVDRQREVWQGWTMDMVGFTCDFLNQRYARVAQDGTVSIRDLENGRELQHFQTARETKPGRALTFSPDGQLLAWIDAGGRVQAWPWKSGKPILKSSPENCVALAYSPDAKQLAVAHGEWVACFDLNTGLENNQWLTRGLISAIDFHPNSHQLAVGYQNATAVAVYDVNNGERLVNVPTGNSTRTVVAWHPDGELLAAGGSDARIQVWNVKARRKVATLEGHVEQITALSFHSRGDLLASTSWDGGVRLWQPSPGRMLMRLPLAGSLGATREEGQWAGIISPSNRMAQLWGIVPSHEYHTFLNSFGDGDSHLREGDISPDSTLLALGASDGVRLWDIARGREVAWLRLHDTTSALFREHGHELLTCGPVDGLQRWHIKASPEPGGGEQISLAGAIPLPFAPMRISKARDDRALAIVSESAGQCLLIDLATGSERSSVLTHVNGGYIALSPNAEWVASSGWHSDRVKVWDGKSGKMLKEVTTNLTCAVFFTPDNRELIVARDQAFIFYDLKTLEVSRRLPREMGLYPGHVAFTADGKLMAVEMSPGVIHLKEFTSGRTLAKLEDPQGDHSTWMSFTPDGTQLIVAARYASAIHRWDLQAIRAHLKSINLDWDWPEFPPSVLEHSFDKKRQPLRMQVVDMKSAGGRSPGTQTSSVRP